MLLLLFLLELLPLLSLPAVKLLLVLLESSVLPGVPGTRRAHSRVGWQFLRMNRASGEPGRLLGAIRAVTPALLGVHNAGFSEIAVARSCCDRRFSVVYRSAQFAIVARGFHMLHLSGDRRNVPIVQRRLFFRSWTRFDTSAPSVVADARVTIVFDDRRVVDVMNFGHVNVV